MDETWEIEYYDKFEVDKTGIKNEEDNNIRIGTCRDLTGFSRTGERN